MFDDGWQLEIDFVVGGTPQPGGSKQARVYKDKDTGKMRALVYDDAKKNKPWRKSVAFAARRVWTGQILYCPIRLEIVFCMPRPKNHYGTGRNSKNLKPTSPAVWHTKKPDATKLVRSTEDALTGVLWQDDAQVVRLIATKRYVEDGYAPSARVRVYTQQGIEQ